MSSPYGIQITENCLICKLRHSGFFCDLPKPSLQDLERIKYASAYPQGAVLFVEGQAPRGVYIICTGRVKLSTTSRDGKTLILRIAQAGEVLGLHATVSGKPYELTAETLQPAQLDFVRREDFDKVMTALGAAGFTTELTYPHWLGKAQVGAFEAIGYPVLPALYIVLAATVAVILLIADKTRAQALSGLALVLIGVPVYYVWRRVERPAIVPSVSGRP